MLVVGVEAVAEEAAVEVALALPAAVVGAGRRRRGRGFRLLSQQVSQQATDYGTCRGTGDAAYYETVFIARQSRGAAPDTAADKRTRGGTSQGSLLLVGHIGTTAGQ